jgi:hypothetical protein
MRLYKCFSLLSFAVFISCTDLEETLNSDLSGDKARKFLQENADLNALIETVYRDFDATFVQHVGATFILNEVSSDEMIVPSRPSGWDNGGVYRQLHQHTWTPTHDIVNSVWTRLNKGVFDATNVLNFNPPDEIAAEARFLRAFFMYNILDLYDRVPYRQPGDNLLHAPVVLSGADATDFIIAELEEILPYLSESKPPYRASKNAARGLLVKLYLNRAVYLNRERPEFDNSDMEKVIQYADAITGKSLNFYWDSFGPNNNEISSELIFTIEGKGGVRSHSQWVIWHATFPSEMDLPNGGGWNGFATLAEFYSSFESNDIRRYYEHPHTMENAGYNVGFLVGQQYDVDGNPIPNVNFRPEVPVIVGASLWDGVRPVKYVPDYDHPAAADNDFVLIRYADVLLMKAEALLRIGQSATALEIVNQIRNNRDVESFTELNLNNLLAERGRELYWEGHRRTDLIRFGKFLEPWHLKEASDPKYLLFPVPARDVLANPNLKQNPGF